MPKDKDEKDQERPKRVVEEVKDEPEPEIQKSEPEPEEVVAKEPELIEEPPEEKPQKGYSTKAVVLVAVITALLVGALAGGIYVYMNGISQLETSEEETESLPTPTATAAPEATPTASPEGEVDLSEFKVSVLNGSGKIGEATKVKNLLTKAGFTVGSTGNAKTFDFTDTVIETKEDVPQSAIDTIKEALADYSLEVGEALTASNSFDIVVTVGSK